MIVSAWSDGGGGYGLRVREEDVSLYFRPEWEAITLHLPGESVPATIALTSSFWSTAPELRSPRIKTFLTRNDCIPWEQHRPPHFELQPLGGGIFRLKWLEKLEGQPALPLD